MIACLTPGCSGPYRTLRDEIADYEYGVERDARLVVCTGCGLVTQDPPVTAEEIVGLYPDHYLAHSGASGGRGVYGSMKALLAQRATRKIAALLPEGGAFLEVGCGNGHLLKRISDVRPDLRMIGVDIEDADRVPIPNFTFHHGQFEEVGIDPAIADVVYLSNLIEHVPDPIVFLAKCRDVLRPGGQVVIVTPSHRSLDRFVFGRYWAGYHFPRHTFVFNDRNLTAMLEDAGFDGVHVRGSYSFWYLSVANRFVELPGKKPRGIAFALLTAAFLPIDALCNLFWRHGSMTVTANRR